MAPKKSAQMAIGRMNSLAGVDKPPFNPPFQAPQGRR